MSPSRWSAYRPSPSAPWDLARAWTLRRRAGFAATWAELQRDLESGPDAAVDRILDGTGRIQGTLAEFASTADLLGDRGRFTMINGNSVLEARVMGETQLGRMQFRIMQELDELHRLIDQYQQD
jgi:hypothetical protein